jgi:hypothetical protein
MIDGQNPVYYQDFSQESRAVVIYRKLKFHLNKLRQAGLTRLPDFIAARMAGISLRASVMRWRIHHMLGLRVNEKHLRDDLDTIVHPASYFYKPQPYPGRIVFLQSTDWPPCRYFDFYASWDGLIAGGMELHKIAGGHQSMFYEENVDLVASKLRDCLHAAHERFAPAELGICNEN